MTIKTGFLDTENSLSLPKKSISASKTPIGQIIQPKKGTDIPLSSPEKSDGRSVKKTKIFKPIEANLEYTLKKRQREAFQGMDERTREWYG